MTNDENGNLHRRTKIIFVANNRFLRDIINQHLNGFFKISIGKNSEANVILLNF